MNWDRVKEFLRGSAYSLPKEGFFRGLDGSEPRWPDARDCVDPSWDPTERKVIADYVAQRRFESTPYMGFSICRFCGCHNGTRDFTDGTYIWPEGFAHYLTEHLVRPSDAFVQHVVGNRP